MDRSKKPEIYAVGMPTMAELENMELGNGATVHILKNGPLPFVRLDLALRAGTYFAPKAMVARATSEMLAEGIPGMVSTEISEKIEYYGGKIWQRTFLEYSVISFVVLDKFFGEVAPLLEQIIKVPTFPEREFGIYMDNERQDFKLRMSKPSSLCAYEFTKRFYAEGSVYGRVQTEEVLNSIRREDLVEYHGKTFGPERMHIFLSGAPSEQTIATVEKMFGGKWGTEKHDAEVGAPEYSTWEQQTKIIDFKGAKQASISMGRVMPTIDAEDVMPMKVVNTIYGGYFGSRLMQNIREEKGLTYGIQSSLKSGKHEGMLRVSSEVSPDKWQLVIDEVFNEMKTLREEPVGQEELEMVRSFMKGTLVQKYDGQMAKIDSAIMTMMSSQPQDIDKKTYETIDTITPETIMQMAQKYLVPEQFKILVVK
ncbi:MAG: insulinase family protein [Bacteroidales bacterium]|nr:insulinase family protein [Bacteroidales bacterium]